MWLSLTSDLLELKSYNFIYFCVLTHVSFSHMHFKVECNTGGKSLHFMISKVPRTKIRCLDSWRSVAKKVSLAFLGMKNPFSGRKVFHCILWELLLCWFYLFYFKQGSNVICFILFCFFMIIIIILYFYFYWLIIMSYNFTTNFIFSSRAMLCELNPNHFDDDWYCTKVPSYNSSSSMKLSPWHIAAW